MHREFVVRLVAILGEKDQRSLLIHLSIPGKSDEDRTAFSRSKRAADRVVIKSGNPYVILRPGFVVAPAAFGGSALMRALAVLPFGLPAREADSTLMITAVGDITRTVSAVAHRWRKGDERWNAVWDVIARERTSVGEVIDAFGRRLGTPKWRLRPPARLMERAAAAGDLAAFFGWSAPIRSTTLIEMRRGVIGDPEPWIAATGTEPMSLNDSLRSLAGNVQEKWFARLYLAKALVLMTLVAFWGASGLISLTVAFDDAAAILIAHGFQATLGKAVTACGSLVDIGVGLAIAFRKTCRAGLIAGIVVSLFYMASAAAIAPELWIEPLGALVKTGPLIVLMLVALAILEDR